MQRKYISFHRKKRTNFQRETYMFNHFEGLTATRWPPEQEIFLGTILGPVKL